MPLWPPQQFTDEELAIAVTPSHEPCADDCVDPDCDNYWFHGRRSGLPTGIASTRGDNRPPAVICRERGWAAGTRLVGDEGYGPTVIEITAVGEERILAKTISHKGQPVARVRNEGSWTLDQRMWTKVEQAPPTGRTAASVPAEQEDTHGAWPVDAPARRDINEDGEAECWLHGVEDCWQEPCSRKEDTDG